MWVLAACRDIQPATVKRAESYPNLILLDRERLRNIYGPTLAAHPDFRKANKSVMAKESIEVIKRTDRTNLMSRVCLSSFIMIELEQLRCIVDELTSPRCSAHPRLCVSLRIVLCLLD